MYDVSTRGTSSSSSSATPAPVVAATSGIPSQRTEDELLLERLNRSTYRRFPPRTEMNYYLSVLIVNRSTQACGSTCWCRGWAVAGGQAGRGRGGAGRLARRSALFWGRGQGAGPAGQAAGGRASGAVLYVFLVYLLSFFWFCRFVLYFLVICYLKKLSLLFRKTIFFGTTLPLAHCLFTNTFWKRPLFIYKYSFVIQLIFTKKIAGPLWPRACQTLQLNP